VPTNDDRLTYFTHEIGGRLYAGWYRRLPGARIEVFTRTLGRREFIGDRSVADEARRVLQALILDDVLESSVVAPRARRSK
jgi:hypothetical protein